MLAGTSVDTVSEIYAVSDCCYQFTKKDHGFKYFSPVVISTILKNLLLQ